MPELPEVETTRRGIAPHLEGRRVRELVVREPRLRWPVDPTLADHLRGALLGPVERRAKYLLLPAGDAGTLILHLGMSGSLRVVPADTLPERHDHLDLVLDDGQALRLRDPRRFGAALWQPAGTTHPRLAELGPEPLGPDFHGDYLYRASRGRRAAVKAFIMDNKVVVGVGNIYATEALFRAGIDPRRAAGRIGRKRYRQLADAIRAVLAEAIEAGGTTLRDFTHSDGAPGYFRIQLAAYGRAGEPCPACGRTLVTSQVGQRATVRCPACQT